MRYVEPLSPDLESARSNAALLANIDGASAWRWFVALLEERRIRGRFGHKIGMSTLTERASRSEQHFTHLSASDR